MDAATNTPTKILWNEGKIVGQKAPLKLKDIWAIRIRLQLGHRTRELALFDLGLDSKLRACDLVRLRVRDSCHGDRMSTRAIVTQQKTSKPVQFEIMPPTREAVAGWIKQAHLSTEDYLFPSRVHDSFHLGTRQYVRILDSWIKEISLDPRAYGLRYPCDSPYKGIVDLPAHEEHSVGAIASRTYHVGKYAAIPLHSGRGCFGTLRADGNLNFIKPVSEAKSAA